MPYAWTIPPSNTDGELHLWPHQSLPVEGYVRILTFAALMLALPLLMVLGSTLMWGLLPFVLLALLGLKWALDRNRRSQQILEVLTLSDSKTTLQRKNADDSQQDWQCNRYWVQVHQHDTDGPIPCYITLSGNGREVEIGAFLSLEERQSLYQDLCRQFRAA